MTNNVYKSLQDNNEDQCIIMLGESSSGKTENCRMIIRFLSRISGKFLPSLQRQRSSNSIASLKSSPKSTCSTPKHNKSGATPTHIIPIALTNEKSSCFKTEGGKNKKPSRVEFDFSYQKCNDIEGKHDLIKYCPKHNCCNVSSSSSSASNPIDIPVRKKSINYQYSNELPTVSKSFTIYETMNRVQNKKVPNCLDQQTDPQQVRCESLDLIKISSQNSSNKLSLTNLSSSFDDQLSKNREKNSSSQTYDSSFDRNNINLDNFKSAKRKVPIKILKNFQLSNIEIQTMKERIAQAEIFLEAMGNASTLKNRDSSRYVSFQYAFFSFLWLLKCFLSIKNQGKYFDLEVDYRGDLIGGHIMHCEYIKLSCQTFSNEPF